MTDLVFTPATPQDDEDLAALWQACGLTRPWNDPARDIAFARNGAESDILIARQNGALVASVMVGHDGHRGVVYYVAVAPEKQSRGYGKQVMAAAENWLKARGVWKLNLLVRAENEKVRGFYEKLGYEVEERLCMARKIMDQNQAC